MGRRAKTFNRILIEAQLAALKDFAETGEIKHYYRIMANRRRFRITAVVQGDQPEDVELDIQFEGSRRGVEG